MEDLIREALAKFEETVVEIEKTKERHFSMAHRKWPAIEPMEARREELREAIVGLLMAAVEKDMVTPRPVCTQLLRGSSPDQPKQLTEEEWHKPMVPSSWKSE